MMDAKTLKHYTIPLDQPIAKLDCVEAFNGLSEQEKLYTYHLSQACWVGGLIVHLQTSPESPAIFTILHDLFKSNGIQGLKSKAVGQCGFTEDEWNALLMYTCGIFYNHGNYKGFGDTKIVPGVPFNKLDALIATSKFQGRNGLEAKAIWNEVKDKVYSLSSREKQLGLGDKGITTYFSGNCTFEDAELVGRFLKKHNIEGLLTRCFKKCDNDHVTYEIRFASVKADDDANKPEVHSFEGCDFILTHGDYSPLLKKLVSNLEQAKLYASNETEKKMLECFMASFIMGNVDDHKEGTRYWIKDKGPVVETHIGFIETYRDPAGARAEYEGFVTIVNRPLSAKFTNLVDQATEFLPLLPWPKEFEMDTFLQPDFTCLDVVASSGSMVWEAINIPNYAEIRQNEGFKNVILANVVPANYKDINSPFLSKMDKHLFGKYRLAAFEVQLGLHELLGHGSGKIFTKSSCQTLNYPSDLKNPLTNELIKSAYEPGDTYDSVFSTIGSAFEECRADCVGMLLSLDKKLLKIFGFEGDLANTIIYTNWLSMVFRGVAEALVMYQPETKAWVQAHSRAWFAILQVLIEAGEGLVTVQEIVGSDGKPDLLMTLDETKIATVGKKAISTFLLKLQVYRSTADVKAATEMFEKYTVVDNNGKYPWVDWREIILNKRQVRPLFVQSNLFLNDAGSVLLKTYEESPEGLIQSWIERFADLSIYNELEFLRKKDSCHFVY